MATNAHAGLFDFLGHPNASFDFNGTFYMYSPSGDLIAEPDNNLQGDMTMDIFTMGGVANMGSSTPFFGFNWSAHDIQFSAHIDLLGDDPLSAHGTMLFDWSATKNLEVDFAMGMDLIWDDLWKSCELNFEISSIDADGDGIPGIAMTSGPFVGFTPAFTGIAHFEGIDLFGDIIDNPGIFHEATVSNPNGGPGIPGDDTAAVPLPGAIWLIGAGLLGLVGIKKK